MTTVALLCFVHSESQALITALKARDPSLQFVQTGPDELSELAGERDAVALIWGPGAGPDGPSPLVAKATEAGIPAVALLPVPELNSIDLARGHVELAFAPFTPDEVAVRIRAAAARAAAQSGSELIVRGELTIDRDRYEVLLSGRRIDLTYKEYELLKFLASSPGRVFSREALLRSVWEYDYFGGTRTVDVHVRRLRSKIDDVRHRFIETVWNVGYRFRAPDDRGA